MPPHLPHPPYTPHATLSLDRISTTRLTLASVTPSIQQTRPISDLNLPQLRAPGVARSRRKEVEGTAADLHGVYRQRCREAPLLRFHEFLLLLSLKVWFFLSRFGERAPMRTVHPCASSLHFWAQRLSIYLSFSLKDFPRLGVQRPERLGRRYEASARCASASPRSLSPTYALLCFPYTFRVLLFSSLEFLALTFCPLSALRGRRKTTL